MVTEVNSQHKTDVNSLVTNVTGDGGGGGSSSGCGRTATITRSGESVGRKGRCAWIRFGRAIECVSLQVSTGPGRDDARVLAPLFRDGGPGASRVRPRAPVACDKVASGRGVWIIRRTDPPIIRPSPRRRCGQLRWHLVSAAERRAHFRRLVQRCERKGR